MFLRDMELYVMNTTINPRICSLGGGAYLLLIFFEWGLIWGEDLFEGGLIEVTLKADVALRIKDKSNRKLFTVAYL